VSLRREGSSAGTIVCRQCPYIGASGKFPHAKPRQFTIEVTVGL
jgi:hypothetical protein